MKRLLVAVFLVFVTFTQSVLANDEIISDNTGGYEIVVPSGACPVVRFAGQELQYFLSKSLNTKVPVVKIPNNEVTSIILGGKLLNKTEINTDDFVRDEYIIKSIGNNIYIAGKDDPQKDPRLMLKRGIWSQFYERGTLMGVYGFLEKYLGVRFYFPGEIGTVIPKRKELVLNSINIRKKPDYTVRNFSVYSGMTPDGENGSRSYPFKNLNYYRLRMQTRYLPNCHGLSRFGYLTRFGKTHPEYFALQSDGKRNNDPTKKHTGQLCFSSKIREHIYQDAVAFLTGKSAKEAGVLTDRFGYVWDPSAVQAGYFNIMPQDGFYKCKCPKCQVHFSQGPIATSAFLWNFFCEVADKLKKNNIPGYVTTMSYPPYNIVPKRKIPDNLLVMVQERGPWSMHKAKILQKEQSEIEAWKKKLGQKIWLWNYPNKYGSLNIPGVPALTPMCIGKYYKLNSPYIFGAFMESETDFYIFNYLNYYVFSKVSWNNSTDVELLLKEHYQKMFGPAAKIMEQIFQNFEQKWLKIMGKTVESNWGPTSKPVTNYVLWNTIYNSTELTNLEKQFTKAAKLTVNSPDNLKRVKFMRKHFFDRLDKQRKEFFKNKQQSKDLTLYTAFPKGNITIDGNLNDDAWKQAQEIYLVPFKKANSKKVVKTTVKVLCDDENMYISYFCEEPLLNKMQTSKRKADDLEIYKDSSIEFFMNPIGDKTSYYQFIINASGSLTDIYCNLKDGQSVEWTSNAKIATGRTAKAWTVEMAIPLKSLKDFKKHSFPVNFNRNRVLSNSANNYVKLYTWSRFLKKNFHDLENFGRLIFKKKNDANLVKNSTFTLAAKGLNVGGWYATPRSRMQQGDSWKLDGNVFIKGGKSFMIKASSNKGRIKIAQPLAPLKPNTEYRLTYFVKTKNVVADNKKRPGGVCANIWITRNHWYPRNRLTGTMPWTKMSFKFKTAANIKKQRPSIMLWLMHASGTVWFDNIRLLELPIKTK